jgi:AcrR family transcriptional regulator
MGSVDRRERERQEMREMILAAAMKLFLAESFEKTTMRRIADAIEYTPGALYSYFKDKDEILYALHQRGFDVLLSMMQEAVDSNDDAVLKLQALGRTYLRFAFEQPQYYDLMFISSATARSIAQRDCWEPGAQSYEMMLQAVIACVEQGRIPGHPDPNVVALSLWANVHGLAALCLRNRLVNVPQAERQDAINSAYSWISHLAAS